MERLSFFLARYHLAVLTVFGVLVFVLISLIFRFLGTSLKLWSAVAAISYSLIFTMVLSIVIKRIEARAFNKVSKRLLKYRSRTRPVHRGSLDDLNDEEINCRLRR